MTIKTGDKLPDAMFLRMGQNGPEEVPLASLTEGRKVVIFSVVGAFTATCHSAHMPSFIAKKDALKAKGVEDIICVAVNDPFVLKAWDEATGASAAGIQLLSDGTGAFTKSIGMDFDAPPVGLMGRPKRYAMVVDDGVVSLLNVEDSPGTCDVSGADAVLAAM